VVGNKLMDEGDILQGDMAVSVEKNRLHDEYIAYNFGERKRKIDLIRAKCCECFRNYEVDQRGLKRVDSSGKNGLIDF